MEITEKIRALKKERNALILAHFYQPPEIQAIADIVGDSLELSRSAKDSKSDVIVFCGVYFMAESAKILSPQKTVLIPNKAAGCPMADMIRPQDVREMRSRYPNATVVTYINSSAAVKAESDICCTSANALKVVNAVKSDEIIFIPDQNLGSYVARFSDKTFHFFDGYCHVHNKISVGDVAKARADHPGVPILVHPECPAAVVDLADFVGSTSQIINFVSASDEKQFIIGTEKGVLYPLSLKNPNKVFYMLAENFLCPNMKKTSLEHVLESLESDVTEVELGDEIIEKASKSLSAMFEVK